MRQNYRIFILAAVAVLLLIGAVSLVAEKKKELQQVPKYGNKPMPVTAIKAQKGDLNRKKDYLGVVEPAREAEVSTKVSAKVEEVLVDEGDRVDSGELLIELDFAEIRHKLGSMQSKIQEAKANLSGNRATVKSLESSYQYWKAEKERNQDLLQKGAVATSEAQRVADRAAEVRGRLTAAKEKSKAIQESISSLRKQVQEIRARLEYYSISSQYSGTVSERLVDPGDMASPSKPLLRVEDRKALKISFDIPQEDFPEVDQGQEVVFSLQGKEKRAKLSLVYPSLNPARMKTAEVWLQEKENKGLTPGAYLPVSVIVQEFKNITLVPRSALIPSPRDKKHVFAVEENRLQAREVKVLGTSGDKIAVEGVPPGTRVVQNTFLGWNRLSTGEKVEVIQ